MYQKLVRAPASTSVVPLQTQWSMMRENSDRIVRAHTALGGTSTPSICSTVLQ
jgi:hypothetical protein